MQPHKPAQEKRAPEWTTKPERSNILAIRLIAWIARTLGRSAARLFLYPICGYFMLSSPKVRAASKKYLHRALGREPRLADGFRHCHTFASTILDRVFLLDDRIGVMDVRIHGQEALRDMVAEGRGCIMLGAHLGSFEIVRSLSREKFAPPACMVIYEENARKLNSVLHAINPELSQRVIELGKPDSMLKVGAALARGEFIGILADRVIEGEGNALCDFLGESAKFPTGPMRMAYMLKAPVMLMVGLYRGGNRYDVYFEKLQDMGAPAAVPREAVIGQAVRDYAARIEYYCRMAPYNWFNFFDFWR